jgi:thiamine kinase-like enzyme
MSKPIDDPMQAISTAELRVTLEAALSRHLGTAHRIAELERRPAATQSSFALEEIDVRLDDGSPLQLMFKNLSQQGLLEGARQAKPAFLYDPLREIETYRAILMPNQLGPACYGTVVYEQLGRYWLFLERVLGLELYWVALPTWQQVARWLAAMHTRFAEETELLMQTAHLLRYNSDYYRLWMRRARTFARQHEPSQPRDTRQGIEWLAKRYDQVVERLVELPVTFIHGEFYASNVLVQATAGDLRVCPVDWEMAAVGPGLLDLAALTAGSWTDEEKKSLAMAYHATLPQDGGWMPTPDAFLTALDYCNLHLAVQWLGWSQEWSAPPEHAQNWHAEALRLAEKLRL